MGFISIVKFDKLYPISFLLDKYFLFRDYYRDDDAIFKKNWFKEYNLKYEIDGMITLKEILELYYFDGSSSGKNPIIGGGFLTPEESRAE